MEATLQCHDKIMELQPLMGREEPPNPALPTSGYLSHKPGTNFYLLELNGSWGFTVTASES